MMFMYQINIELIGDEIKNKKIAQFLMKISKYVMTLKLLINHDI
jgi:hypothetical protein